MRVLHLIDGRTTKIENFAHAHRSRSICSDTSNRRRARGSNAPVVAGPAGAGDARRAPSGWLVIGPSWLKTASQQLTQRARGLASSRSQARLRVCILRTSNGPSRGSHPTFAAETSAGVITSPHSASIPTQGPSIGTYSPLAVAMYRPTSCECEPRPLDSATSLSNTSRPLAAVATTWPVTSPSTATSTPDSMPTQALAFNPFPAPDDFA